MIVIGIIALWVAVRMVIFYYFIGGDNSDKFFLLWWWTWFAAAPITALSILLSCVAVLFIRG
jgi:hypothetical protein